MVIRIKATRPEGDGVAIEAGLVDDKDPTNPVELVSHTFHFDSETTPVAAMTEMQKTLNQEVGQTKKRSKLMEAFPEGKGFDAKTEAAAARFLGMD